MVDRLAAVQRAVPQVRKLLRAILCNCRQKEKEDCSNYHERASGSLHRAPLRMRMRAALIYVCANTCEDHSASLHIGVAVPHLFVELRFRQRKCMRQQRAIMLARLGKLQGGRCKVLIKRQ